MTKALANNFNILRLKPVLVEPNLHYVQEYNVQEKTAALESAKEYLEYDPSDRDRDIAITVVKQVRNSVEITILNLLLVIVFQFDNTNNFTLQGHEPPHFTGFFGAWDRELFKVGEFSVFPVRILEQNRTLKFDQNLYPTHFIRLHLWMR